MWRELYADLASTWAGLLERFELAEDATADDLVEAIRKRLLDVGVSVSGLAAALEALDWESFTVEGARDDDGEIAVTFDWMAAATALHAAYVAGPKRDIAEPERGIAPGGLPSSPWRAITPEEWDQAAESYHRVILSWTLRSITDPEPRCPYPCRLRGTVTITRDAPPATWTVCQQHLPLYLTHGWRVSDAR